MFWSTLDEIFQIFGALLRFVGLLVLGLGLGWLVLEFFRKSAQVWQLQIAIILGTLGTIIGMTRFAPPAALGGFALGFGAAMLLWGKQKEKEQEKKKED